jgi:hypothetical protein
MTAENLGWLVATIIATPISSLLCCWIGILLGNVYAGKSK